MTHLPAPFRNICLALGLIALAGCGSSPTPRFYTLHAAVKAPAATTAATTAVTPAVTLVAAAAPQSGQAGPVVVGVGPVEIPDYLDRPQLVTLSEQNRMRLLEFDLWAGSLKADIGRVLMENLAALLPPDRFSIVSWRQGAQMDYRVALHVHRFDVGPGGVLLSAQWMLFTKERRAADRVQGCRLTEASGSEPGEAAAAMSRALGRLSEIIAQKIAGTAR
jgi:hypothetical protein